MPYDASVVRWLSAIFTIACVVLGSRSAADATRLAGTETAIFETTQHVPLVQSLKRSGMQVRDVRRGSRGSVPPAVLPDAIALPVRGRAAIDELVAVADDHHRSAIHRTSARAPPRL